MSEEKSALIRHYIKRADDTFADANLLAREGRWNSCLNRLYYACFYIVYAVLLDKIAFRTKTHSGIKTLFNKHIIKEGLAEHKASVFYAYLFNKRGEADYSDFEIFSEEEVAPLVGQAGDFINAIKKLISIK